MIDCIYTYKEIKIMENQKNLSEATLTPSDASDYLDTVRAMYRNDEADYRGQRSPEQKLIAGQAAEQADTYFDSAVLGVLAIATMNKDEEAFIDAVPSTAEERTTTLGGAENAVTLTEMRDAWRQVWTAMSVMTNRLERDSARFKARDLQAINNLPEADRTVLMQTLFNQFQDVNSLRFGVQGFGLSRTRRMHNEDGGIDEFKYDPDVATEQRGVSANAARRRYTVKARSGEEGGNAVHTVGKLSPKELVELRREFPEVEADEFFTTTSFRKNAITAFRGK